MGIYLKNTPAKFHPIRFETTKLYAVFVDGRPNKKKKKKKKKKNKMSSDVR